MIWSFTLIAVQHVTLMSQVVIFSGKSFFFQTVTWAFSLFKEASKLIKPGHVDEMRMRKEKTFQRLRKRWKRIFWSAWENIFHGCVQLWILIERIMHLSSFLQNISLLPPSINSITKFYKFKELKTLNSSFVQYWNHCNALLHICTLYCWDWENVQRDDWCRQGWYSPGAQNATRCHHVQRENIHLY